jgi:hypothetical protein
MLPSRLAAALEPVGRSRPRAEAAMHPTAPPVSCRGTQARRLPRRVAQEPFACPQPIAGRGRAIRTRLPLRSGRRGLTRTSASIASTIIQYGHERPTEGIRRRWELPHYFRGCDRV